MPPSEKGYELSDADMDAAVLKFRRFSSVEEFYRELSESPAFKAALEAAYARGQREPAKDFIHLDAQGWHPRQYCAPAHEPPPPTPFAEKSQSPALFPVTSSKAHPTASPAMAARNIPHHHQEHEHSGISSYSDEMHVGRVDAASGKSEDNFRIDPSNKKKATRTDTDDPQQ
jgi:hypothetical protein